MLLLFDENVPRDLATHYQTAGHNVLMVGIDLEIWPTFFRVYR